MMQEGNNIQERTCCFTGHRAIPKDIFPNLVQKLDETIATLYQSGMCCFRTGGAVGFDTEAAEAVLRFRNRSNDVKLILILPCPEQAKNWNIDARSRYEHIKSQADKIIYTSDYYTRGCMQKRNRCLVDGSSVCVAYCTQTAGGSAYTVRYAKQKGLQIIFL